MHITPRQRRRSVRAHYLRQRGQSLKQIADTSKTSVATVRADLKLAETHWSSIAAATADDLLLESLFLLKTRLSIAIAHDSVADNAKRLTPVEYLRARDAQETQLNSLAREIRRTVQDVHRRAEQRPDQPGLFDEEPENPQELAETSTKLSQIEPPKSTISSPQQEIVPSDAPEEKILPETAESPVPAPERGPAPLHDPVISEAIELFPHLRRKSDEQILNFLEKLTDPNAKTPEIPIPAYTEAAG